jgi:hypothetical protein
MSKMERLVKKKVFIGTSGFSLFNSNWFRKYVQGHPGHVFLCLLGT